MKTLKFPSTILLLTLLTWIINDGYSQSCSSSLGTLPYNNQQNKCRKSINSSSFSDTWEDRINDYNQYTNNKAGWKRKYRSVFVNQSVNRTGGFAVPDNNGIIYYFDPNAVGSAFGIDGDNNGIYEREDALLQDLKDNDFDELVLYNVSSILEDGDQIAKDFISIQKPFNNIMQEEEKMDWHLARFIYKAKTQYGFKVVATVPEDATHTEYSDRFYDFFNTYARTDLAEKYAEVIAHFQASFIAKYQELWLNAPQDLRYLKYGQDTLFLPVDNQGRISYLDKAIVDIYNVNLFEYKVKSGLINITQGETSSPIGTGASSCDNGFDGHLFEWEWWNYSTKQQAIPKLDALIALMGFSSSLQNIADICYPKHYVAKNEFMNLDWGEYDANNNWVLNDSIYEQQRANRIDSAAHRVYLYSYNKNPCDCYWGRANLASNYYKDFNHRVALLANNGFGADNGTAETFILPVFLAKTYDAAIIASADTPLVYGDNKKGCNYDLDSCDYCNSKSGTALNDLANNGLSKRLGYVENIFQEQYDFDAINTSAANSDNHIFGYCWFKSRLLQDNGYISSKTEIAESKNMFNIYPNPSKGLFVIEGTQVFKSITIYTLNGVKLNTYLINDSRYTFSIQKKGVYIVAIENQLGEVEHQKIIKW